MAYFTSRLAFIGVVMRFRLLLLMLLAPVATLRGQDSNDWLRLPPLSPDKSLQQFEVRPGFRVELAASEPLVADPISIAFGPDGKLWVVEMGGYPKGDASAPQAAGGGRIKVLTDADGDGRFDSATVFLDGLGFATGVLPWREGVLVTCAPEIFYARDTDGDGRADVRRTLFRGFGQGNPQHLVNHPTWGLDHWIHVANGDSNGLVESSFGGDTVDIQGHDIRIRPDEGWLELESGMSQFGRCCDDWGNWFGVNNARPIWHGVLEDRYLRRTTVLAPPESCVSLTSPPTHPPVYPRSRSLPRFNEPATESCVTSACGGCIYRDDTFGPGYHGSYFVCEPAHNLVHHALLVREGATFYATRPDPAEESEFLASRDNWFRPTQARTGPDGALWVVDMYRLVIEHPEYFLPGESGGASPEQLETALRAGSDRGRIYRIVPDSGASPQWTPPANLRGAELARRLESPHGAIRDLAHQLIFERREFEAASELQRIAAASPRPASRLQALCALDGIGALGTDLLVQAMQDPDAWVRRQAVRLAESRLAAPPVQQALLALADDPDPAVRLQLACSLGHLPPGRGGAAALCRIAVRDARDPLLVAAVGSSVGSEVREMLQQFAPHVGESPAHAKLLTDLMQLALDHGKWDAVAAGLERLSQPIEGRYEAWQFQALAALLRDWEYDGRTLRTLHEMGDVRVKRAVLSLHAVFDEARRTLRDEDSDPALCVEAVQLLGRWLDGRDEDAVLLAELMSAQQPWEVQRQAAESLARLAPPNAPEVMLREWRQHGPKLRSFLLDVLLERRDGAMFLLDQLESGVVAAVDIDARHREQLKLHYHAPVRRRAAELLEATSSSRAEVLRRFESAVHLTGNADRGAVLFEKHCAACHLAAPTESAAGPDLGALTNRSPENLLTAILDPNRSVEPQYLSYVAVTLDGRVLTGLVASESGSSIVLVAPDGKRQVLLRRRLETLSSTGNSLMPEGLEQQITTPQELADLMEYVRRLAPHAAVPERIGPD